MNRPNPKDQDPPFAVITASLTNRLLSVKSDSRSANRLIVLVPADSDYGATSGRIWELAVATCRHVQLLSLCKDIVEEPSVRRQLILMSALVGDIRISTQAQVEVGVNWIGAVKRNYQLGDIIVCFEEHRDGLFQKPLSQILEAGLDAPIYILSSPYTQEYPRSRSISQAILWTGWIGFIVGSFLLQSRIAHLPNDWIETSLLILSVIFEFWLIWVWNNLFS